MASLPVFLKVVQTQHCFPNLDPRPHGETPEMFWETWLFSLDADFPELIQILGGTNSVKLHTHPTLLQSSAMSSAPFFFQITYSYRQALHLGDRSTLVVPIEDSLKMDQLKS